MAKTRIGSLNVALTLNSKKFTAGVTFAQKKISRFTTSVAKMGAKIFFIREAMQTAGAALKGLFGDIPAAINKLDDLATTAAKLGVGTQELQGLRNAARLTGVEVRTFDMGLQRAVRRIAEAGVGAGEAQGALRELGLSAAKMAKLAPEKQFFELARAMSGVDNAGDRVRLAMKLFDSEGVALVNTLGLGAGALKQHVTFVKALGSAYGEGAQAAGAFNQQLLRNQIVSEAMQAQDAAVVAKRGEAPMQRAGRKLADMGKMLGIGAAYVGSAVLGKVGALTSFVDSGLTLDVAAGLDEISDAGIDWMSKRGTHAGEATTNTAANLPGGPTGAGQGPMLAALERIGNNTAGIAPETQ